MSESADDPVLAGVLAAFAEVLGKPVGAEKSFTAAGGNSLQLAKLAAALRTAFDVPVRLAEVATLATPRRVAEHLRQALSSP